MFYENNYKILKKEIYLRRCFFFLDLLLDLSRLLLFFFDLWSDLRDLVLLRSLDFLEERSSDRDLSLEYLLSLDVISFLSGN